jgi:hypothetical protein
MPNNGIRRIFYFGWRDLDVVGYGLKRPRPFQIPVALIAMMFPNDKNGMRVKPLLVSREAAQRSGGLPTLIPFR